MGQAKLAKQAFQGRLGLRGRTLSGASLMAQQGQFNSIRNVKSKMTRLKKAANR
jgi:hypothetical protein